MTSILAVAAGLICGSLNLWLLTAAGRRLADSGRAKPFVFSSLFRLGLFAIVAGFFAVVGPWPMTLYIVGLFVPLALHVAGLMRDADEKT